jgi:hypothetical protein
MRVRVALVLAVVAKVVVVVAQPERQAEWLPVSQLPLTEQMPAAPLLVGAYVVVLRNSNSRNTRSGGLVEGNQPRASHHTKALCLCSLSAFEPRTGKRPNRRRFAFERGYSSGFSTVCSLYQCREPRDYSCVVAKGILPAPLKIGSHCAVDRYLQTFRPEMP